MGINIDFYLNPYDSLDALLNARLPAVEAWVAQTADLERELRAEYFYWEPIAKVLEAVARLPSPWPSLDGIKQVLNDETYSYFVHFICLVWPWLVSGQPSERPEQQALDLPGSMSDLEPSLSRSVVEHFYPVEIETLLYAHEGRLNHPSDDEPQRVCLGYWTFDEAQALKASLAPVVASDAPPAAWEEALHRYWQAAYEESLEMKGYETLRGYTLTFLRNCYSFATRLQPGQGYLLHWSL